MVNLVTIAVCQCGKSQEATPPNAAADFCIKRRRASLASIKAVIYE